MSKLGKKIILLPKDSNIKVEKGSLLISGPKGSKKIDFNEKLFSSKLNDKNEFQILPNKKTKNISLKQIILVPLIIFQSRNMIQ